MPEPTRTVHAAHLFVPAVRPDLAEKASQSPASAIIVDLEDSVPDGVKRQARQDLLTVLRPLQSTGKHLYVRVNNEPELLRQDILQALAAGATGLVLPKADSVEQLHEIDDWVSAWEQDAEQLRGFIDVELQIETATGLLNAAALAAALERTSSVMLGVEDFSTELGIDPNDADTDLGWAHGHVLLAAVAAGKAPYGLIGAFSNYKDLSGYAAAARRSSAFGYVGAYCIHPAQVPLVMEAFSASPAHLDQARRVVQAYEKAQRQGRSATSLDGSMIDRPVAERAHRLLRRAGTHVSPRNPSEDQP